MSKPVIVYFPIRGRAEAIRVALALKGVEWDDEAVDFTQQKEDREKYPFGQCPRYKDGDLDLVQTNTILRYIANKYGLWGSNPKETTTTDMIMEGVESLRLKYVDLIYKDQLSDEAKGKFWETHINKATHNGRNGGAHIEFLARFVRASATGWVAGTPEPTIGDVCLWEMMDILFRIWGEELGAAYPEIKAHHDKLAALAGVKEYLASGKRPTKVNGNPLG